MAAHASTGKPFGSASLNSTRAKQSQLRQRRALGQCFLRDRGALEKIATGLGPLRQKIVVEIGGGDGALTQQLTEAKKLIIYELDPRFAALLRARFPKSEIRNENFLKADLAEFKNDYSLIGNIPYAISGLIFRKILTGANHPTRLVFTVQREYAERLLGYPHENFLSNWLRLWGQIEKICLIKRTAFTPAPTVDSIAVGIDFFQAPLLDQPENFAGFLKLLFRQPRKTVGNNLKSSQISIPTELERKRPHQLLFTEILALYRSAVANSTK